MPEHDLFDFMHSATRKLEEEYKRIRKHTRKDPGTAGDQGEENWKQLLGEWLPSYFHIVTKGCILNRKGEQSPQVDVLVLSPTYPKHLLNNKYYLAGGVVAAFECKTTLKAGDVKKTAENAVMIRRLLPKREGSPYKELHNPIVYGLLAHSHSWKSERSAPTKHIGNLLWENNFAIAKHPSEMLDLVCVADLATWSAQKLTFIGPSPQQSLEEWKASTQNSPFEAYERGCAATGYWPQSVETADQKRGFTPVGALLTRLYYRLAWDYTVMQPMAEYFSGVGLEGSWAGKVRPWALDSVYSRGVADRIQHRYHGVVKPWDEWSVAFV